MCGWGGLLPLKPPHSTTQQSTSHQGESDDEDDEWSSGDTRARQLALVAHGDEWMERIAWLKQQVLHDPHGITFVSSDDSST